VDRCTYEPGRRAFRVDRCTYEPGRHVFHVDRCPYQCGRHASKLTPCGSPEGTHAWQNGYMESRGHTAVESDARLTQASTGLRN